MRLLGTLPPSQVQTFPNKQMVIQCWLQYIYIYIYIPSVTTNRRREAVLNQFSRTNVLIKIFLNVTMFLFSTMIRHDTKKSNIKSDRRVVCIVPVNRLIFFSRLIVIMTLVNCSKSMVPVATELWLSTEYTRIRLCNVLNVQCIHIQQLSFDTFLKYCKVNFNVPSF